MNAAPSSSPVATDAAALRGEVHILVAFDVGLGIDLVAAEDRLKDGSRQRLIRVRRAAPAWFEYEPAPIRVGVEGRPVAVGERRTEPTVECVLHDFGAVCLTFRLPLEGRTDELPSLGALLTDHAGLHDEARRVLDQIVDVVRSAIEKPNVSALVEDHLVLVVREHDEPASPSAFLDAHADAFAQFLQADRAALAPELVRFTLQNRLSYAPDDLAVADWNGVILFDRAPEDVLALVQHANVELLEMRILDARLDEMLDRSRELVAKVARRPFWPSAGGGRELRRFAEVQTDTVSMFEGVNNAIKVLGDQYLARVHRMVSTKLDLAQWQGNVQRKLGAVESVYQKMTDAEAARRTEMLEIIIIVLIAVEIVMALLGT